MKVHCLFEQSGTFKNVFKELGYDAISYDLENRFNETDNQIDLFKEIDLAYEGKISIFDKIEKNDLVLAFFPCTYFSVQNDLIFSKKTYAFNGWDEKKKEEYILNRLNKRKEFFLVFKKFIHVLQNKNIKCIIENPYNGNYLLTQETIKPNLIIENRRELGDYYKKPTMFYFININPTYLPIKPLIINKIEKKNINNTKGITRSLINPVFAYNFIIKYILGV